MGKNWDKAASRERWIFEFAQIFIQCRRVMKPGAHGFVWALPRTSHWTATALEDAGFEIRDVVMHLFGSGFPKSLNVGKAVKTHEGWGTALKPAAEHWILIRKPLSEKTVAKNVVKHGTGGINIDGCRVETDWNTDPTRRGYQGKGNGPGGFTGHRPISGEKIKPNSKGRFPSHLIVSGEARDELDRQSGVSKSNIRPPTGKDQRGKPSIDNYTVRFKDTTQRGHADAGGASRFFYNGGDECNASTAETNSDRLKRLDGFVQELVAIEERLEDKPLKDLTLHFTHDMQIKLNNVAEINTLLIQFTVEKYLLELKHIESWNDSPALNAELQKLMDITMTMTNLLTFNGYAEAVTLKSTSVYSEAGARDFARFRYCAKASKSERGPANNHPTVKAQRLMRYLIRMITPPHGTVLDPFMGSGSTGVAAYSEGMEFYGIEKEPDYFEIAKKRIDGIHSVR